MKKIILILCVLLFAFTAKAQVINVCGTDSITLTVDNYVNGTIEWQESIDTLSWVTIPEVSGITYRFLPDQTKYYRAVVKTTDCQPLYSAISLVQLIPIANAGTDRIIGNSSMTLLGNAVPGATGEWTILSGSGGVLDNPTNPQSLFTGLNKENYSLKWTLTNACGQSSDIVTVAFDQVIVKNNFIVIDKTDSLFSDSTEISKGILRVKFSDPTIAPFDSVMLIGMREDISFLLRVTSFTLLDSVYSFTTVQGKFDDLFKSGYLNFGDAINKGLMTKSSSIKAVNNSYLQITGTYPTRKTILENYSNTNDIKLLYCKKINTGQFLSKESLTQTADDNSVILNIKDMTLFTSPDNALSFSIQNSYVKVEPRFVLDRKIDWFPPFLHYLKLGVDNGNFEYNINTKLIAQNPNFLPKQKIKLLNLKYPIVVTVGLAPIPFTLDFDINAELKAEAIASVTIEQNQQYKLIVNAFVEKKEGEEIKREFHMTDQSKNDANLSIQGSLSAEFTIGPEISFRAFGVLGPYLEIPVKIETGVCASTNGLLPDKLNWQAKYSIGVDGNLGVNAEFGDWTLVDFHVPIFKDAFEKSLKIPGKLEYLSGDSQTGTAGKKLSKPITFKVLSTNQFGSDYNAGFGVPFVPVQFEVTSGNGLVDQKVKWTNAQGIVSVDWTLGTNPLNILKVSVLDCDNNDIENSPEYIYANSISQTYDCANSSLSIDIKTASGYMTPSVSGGTAPYTYSTNGVDYSSTVPKFNVSIAGNNTVYVKDKNQCIRTKAFIIQLVDACASSNLSLDVLVQPNILTIAGKNGKTPYQFAVDNTASFTTTSNYYKLSAGKHTVYVKDANGCMTSNEVTIDNATTASIRASYPAQGATSIPITPNTFQWTAATYATNQLYDLYLKKGTDAYSLIASGLSSTSYTYSTALVASTVYTWKVAVKTGSTVIDYSEFTFTTASGVTTAPNVPVLLQPGNGASVYSPATFKWTPQAGDFKYDLYLDANNASTLVALNLTTAECTVSNLIIGKTYYWKVKIKSTITGATATSAVRSFTIQNSGTVTDIDGNVYHTIQIGTQTWMVENLKTTRYRTGEAIGTTTPATKDITGETTPKYQWAYNGNESNVAKYGRLYTWYAATDNRNIAPAGWHVASDAEWTTLENYLIANGYNYDGTTTGNKIAKSLAATTDWYTYTGTGTIGNDLTKNNTSGFTALPGGGRYFNGAFLGVGIYGYWWSSTETNTTSAWYGYLVYNSGDLGRNFSTKSYGFSVRCVRDY